MAGAAIEFANISADEVYKTVRDKGLTESEAARFVVSGKDRFARAVRWWESMCADAAVLDDVQVPGTGPVVFGSGKGRPRFVDNNGIPIFIDKWGLVQRPFRRRER